MGMPHATIRTLALRAQLVGLLLCTACPGNDSGDLVSQGARIYKQNCIACHNIDPMLDGATGPAVAGSSLELIEARVMRAQYPPGYVPKKPSAFMVPLPFLQKEIPALAAYLGSLPAQPPK